MINRRKQQERIEQPEMKERVVVPTSTYLNPTISEDYLRCFYADITLSVNQTIDYLSAAETKPGVGRIEAFKYAGYNQQDTESAWMNIVEVITDKGTNSRNSEWVSVRVWYEQHKEGRFTNQKIKNDNSTKPPVVRKPAF